MDVAVVRSNIRSVVGLVSIGLVLTAVMHVAPHSGDSQIGPWQPPAGYVVADTVPVSGDRVLRLWLGPTGWYVESLFSGTSESTVGADRGRDQFAISEILGGFVGTVPAAGTSRVSIRSAGGPAVVTNAYDGMFLVPAHIAGTAEPQLLITPLDARGKPLTDETSVPIAGRT